MSQIIIEAKNIGKKYRITHQRGGYVALRDVLMNIIRRPFAYLKAKASNTVGLGGTREDFWALKNINFKVKKGEVIGIIGRNGAGKSTLLKILSQITPPTTGEIVIHGRVGSLLEVGTGFHPELTGRENIFLNGAILGMGRKEIAKKFNEIVSFSGVEKFLDTPVKHYSSGMTVRLAFSVAAHLDPDILIVDEVLAVGDAEFQKKCLGKMEEVTQQEGRTIIFVSHNMAAIEQLCTSCILLENGEITAVGPTAEIASLYEKKFAGAANVQAVAERKTSPKPFYLSRVALTDLEGNPRTDFNYGDSMRITIDALGEAQADGYTIEFNLFDEDGTKISFGAANPVRQTFYKKSDKQYVLELGPLPLMTGIYSFDFSARLWGNERWDNWEQAIAFEIRKCDPWNTGHSIPGRTNGSFVIDQKWS